MRSCGCNKQSPIDSLSNYRNEVPTRSCYLDGRYVPIVLSGVREFHKQPIILQIELDKNIKLVHSHASGTTQIREGMNIIRVVIETPSMSHSALLWIDTRDKSMVFTDIRDNEVLQPRLDKIMIEADKIIDEMLTTFFSHLKYSYSKDIAYIDESLLLDEQFTRDEWIANCGEFHGLCNAFVIKQVMDYHNDRAFDPTDIRKLAGAIERRYGHLLDPYSKPEIEYAMCYIPTHFQSSL